MTEPRQSTRVTQRVPAWVHAHPLLAPMLAGAAVRAIAATVALGFHARDDYFHLLDPALRFVADSGFDWDHSGLPGAGIRSHLVPRLLQGILLGLDGLGVSEPESVLRGVYLCLGAYSLLVIPAVAFSARRVLGERGARIATWLAALHFVMPYAGTRLLLGALAMPPVALAVGLATSRRGREIALAGLCLGLAFWLRYQTAVIGVGITVVVLWRARASWQSLFVRFAQLMSGAGIALVAQGLFDLATTGMFLGPLLKNLAMNLCAASPAPGAASCAWVQSVGLEPNLALTRSSPLAYVGFWLLLTVPPATAVLLPALVRAGRRLPLAAWPFVLFLVAHSLVPHKEERFMLPAMPLFLLLLAATPAAIAEGAGRSWDRLRRLWPVTVAALIVVHLLALGIAVTSQSQLSARQALLALRVDGAARAVISLGPEVPAFFLDRAELPVRRRAHPEPRWFQDLFAALHSSGISPNRFLGFADDRGAIEILLSSEGLDCDPPQHFAGWWLDRLVYRLNPAHNRRRAPVLLWRCEQPALANR